jgi:hypothetical protein
VKSNGVACTVDPCVTSASSAAPPSKSGFIP